jgi:hypothetical protein
MTGRSAGDEISSTYEGRHITVLESALTHPTHADGLVDGGDPVLLGDLIVGVALSSASAATDYITIDTEGIWALTVQGVDADGNVAVAEGDQVYINKTTCVLSKNDNKNTHQRFGYALSPVVSGVTTTVVAVKVHFDPDDAEELVGTSAANFTSSAASHIFREYRYTASNVTGDHRGIYTALTLTGAGASGEAIRARTVINAAVAGGVHGLHGGVEFGASGSVTGLAAGVRATYMASNGNQAASIYGGMSELYAGGASTDYGTATEHAIHCFNNGGDGTGAATADNVFAFTGLSGTQFCAATNAVIDHALQVQVNGTTYWIGLYDATA